MTFGIHEIKPKQQKGRDAGAAAKSDDSDGDKSKDAASNAKPDDSEDRPDLVIWHWKDSRLQSMQQVQENRDKNFSFLCAYRPSDQKFLRLADPQLKDVSVTPEQKFAVGLDVRDYELESNLDGKRYEDVYKVDLKTGERQLALRKARWYMGPSPDGTHLLYYDDGTFFSYDLTNGQSHNLTKQIPAVFYNTEDDHNVVKPPARTIGWSKDSEYVLVTDDWDIWKIPANGGAAVNLTGNGKTDKIRYQSIWRLNPDDKGYDLSKPLYVRVYGEWTKKGGIGVLEPGKTGIRMLHWDEASYPNLIKAKDADTYLYARETNQEYPDFYAATSTLENGKKVTDANPQQKNFLWTKGVKLVEYTGARGNKLQGVLYLPGELRTREEVPDNGLPLRKAVASREHIPATRL